MARSEDEYILRTNMFRKSDPEEYGNDLIKSLLIDFVNYNLTDDCYFDEEKVATIQTKLDDILNSSGFSLSPKQQDFFKTLKDIVESYPRYTAIFETSKYPELLVQLACKERGKNLVDGKPSLFNINIDGMLCDSKRLNKVLKRLYKVIDPIENNFDKFCFIEKRTGYVGALTLLPLLVRRYEKNAVIYRPNKVPPLSRLSGEPENGTIKDNSLCLLYDIVASGQQVVKTATNLRRVWRAIPKYAVTLVDMCQDAEKCLERQGTKMISVYELSETDIRKDVEKQWGDYFKFLDKQTK